MRDLSRQDGGEPVSPTHTSIGKYLSGDIARPGSRSCHVMQKVLAHLLGRPVTLDDLGYPDAPPEQADTTLEYPATVGDSITALTQLTGYELNPAGQSAKLHVVPEAWASLLVRAMFGSDEEQAAPTVPQQLTEHDIQAVRDATEMFATFDYRYGGGQPKPLVAKFLETSVLPCIPHVDPATPLGREYFCAVAALTRLAGWTAYDIGEHALAQRYLYQAFRLARAAGDKPLCGRILAGMSHQANFLGHFEHALHLARAAAHGARGHATPTTMALFHAMEARALASLGNERECSAALAEAERWLCHRNPDNDPDWIRYFDEAELHAEFAHCFRDLGNAELANHHAAASIATSENLYVRSLSFCRTVLATSHLQANELEQAVEVARGVVDTAAHLKSYRVLAYVDDFRRRLVHRSQDPVIKSFEEYAAARLAAPGWAAIGEAAS